MPSSKTPPVVYGIPNCDTVKKARAWLAEHGVAHAFHDFRKDGVSDALIGAWLDELGADRLINRRGTTWRGLDAQAQQQAETTAGALALMLSQPSVIKRPVVDWGDARTVGFDAASWADHIKPK